ncbi:MAG: hypothetical protein ACJAZM_001428 [Cyclobacteriaceae bacterium]|jgi:hypothetical protein
MGNKHPIDRLFQEKLGDIQVQPSIDAWSEINAQLGPTKSTNALYLRVAAAVVILMVSSMVWRSIHLTQQRSTLAVISASSQPDEINYPPAANVVVYSLEIKADVNSKEPTAPNLVAPMQIIPDLEVFGSPKTMIVQELPTIRMEKKEATMISLIGTDVPELNLNQNRQKKISIYYYTQATPESIDASKGKLSKIFDYARTTSPVDWVGDIRSKKDELIENVFSLD